MFALSKLADVNRLDCPVIIAIMRNTWTERLVQDGNKAAGRRDRHDIMVEQGNKELLPAIVLPFCSGLGSVSLGFLWHTDHTHTHKHTLYSEPQGSP